MESYGFIGILKILGDFGILGLVIFLWWQDSRRFQTILDQYKKDMDEQRAMYQANVSLVKDYHSVASDLREVVILNTRNMQLMADEIRQNEYCPMLRVKKEKVLMEVTK